MAMPLNAKRLLTKRMVVSGWKGERSEPTPTAQ
jgi:hypothetical protein